MKLSAYTIKLRCGQIVCIGPQHILRPQTSFTAILVRATSWENLFSAGDL
jgi:hypothetical protein